MRRAAHRGRQPRGRPVSSNRNDRRDARQVGERGSETSRRTQQRDRVSGARRGAMPGASQVAPPDRARGGCPSPCLGDSWSVTCLHAPASIHGSGSSSPGPWLPSGRACILLQWRTQRTRTDSVSLASPAIGPRISHADAHSEEASVADGSSPIAGRPPAAGGPGARVAEHI